MRRSLASAAPAPMFPASTHPVGAALPGSALTDVELTWIEGRLEQQLRFGRVAAERPSGPHKRIASFRAGATFCLLSCTVSDLGLAYWRLIVATAATAGAAYSALPGIVPSGDLLLSLDDHELICAVCREIDMIEASGLDACDVAPDHWRHIANQLTAALPFRSYGAERHAAWLRRRETGR